MQIRHVYSMTLRQRQRFIVRQWLGLYRETKYIWGPKPGRHWRTWRENRLSVEPTASETGPHQIVAVRWTP